MGRGWNALSTIISSEDFNGDGKSDVLDRGWDGTWSMYRGNGAGGFLAAKAVGSGGNISSTIPP
jgi:hypothetical protein